MDDEQTQTYEGWMANAAVVIKALLEKPDEQELTPERLLRLAYMMWEGNRLIQVQLGGRDRGPWGDLDESGVRNQLRMVADSINAGLLTPLFVEETYRDQMKAYGELWQSSK